MTRCGCNPKLEPFEFLIESKSKGPIKGKFKELFPIEKNLDELKEKIICEYNEIIDKLECGIQLDLEFILRDISYVYIKENIFEDNTIYIPPATYVGFSLEKDYSKVDVSTLITRVLTKLKLTEQIENTLYGSYLWLISPYALDKIATDEGFTFEVKMLPVGYENEMHYYRSNSRVDFCNLTYYIKGW